MYTVKKISKSSDTFLSEFSNLKKNVIKVLFLNPWKSLSENWSMSENSKSILSENSDSILLKIQISILSKYPDSGLKLQAHFAWNFRQYLVWKFRRYSAWNFRQYSVWKFKQYSAWNFTQHFIRKFRECACKKAADTLPEMLVNFVDYVDVTLHTIIYARRLVGRAFKKKENKLKIFRIKCFFLETSLTPAMPLHMPFLLA